MDTKRGGIRCCNCGPEVAGLGRLEVDRDRENFGLAEA